MKAMRAIAIFMSLLLVTIDPGSAIGAPGKEGALEKIKTLESYVEQSQYQQALNLVDRLHNDIYDLSQNESRPEITETTYTNHYLKLRVCNPVSEWILKEIVSDDVAYQKKMRLTKDLLKIENPQSSYGLTEQIVFSVYDVGNSAEAAYVSRLDFKPELYLKNMADRLLANNKRPDSETNEKEAFVFKGLPAYRMKVETDVGFEKSVVTNNILIYVPQYKYMLILSFAMYAENYPVYQYILEEILEGMTVGAGYNDPVTVRQRSFTDIYLERQG
jgi:hypothetical protein